MPKKFFLWLLMPIGQAIFKKKNLTDVDDASTIDT